MPNPISLNWGVTVSAGLGARKSTTPQQQPTPCVESISEMKNEQPDELNEEPDEEGKERSRCSNAYANKRIDYFSIREHPLIPEYLVPLYRQDSLLQLAKCFPALDAPTIALLFDMNRGLFAPTYEMLHDCLVEFYTIPEKYLPIGEESVCPQFRKERDWVQGWKIETDRLRRRALRSHAKSLRIGRRDPRWMIEAMNEKERCLNAYNYGPINYFADKHEQRPTISEYMAPLYREESLGKLSRDFPTFDPSAIAVLFDMHHGSFAQTYRKCHEHFVSVIQVPECFHRTETRPVLCPQFEQERLWVDGWKYEHSGRK